MKYLAILKDSFREAMDSKIIYVMLGLSTLVILVVLSMSFEPGSPDQLLQGMSHGYVSGLRMPGAGRRMDREGKVPYFEIRYRGRQILKGEENSPDAEILATYEVINLNPWDSKQFQEQKKLLEEILRDRFSKFEEMGVFQVSEVKVNFPRVRKIEGSGPIFDGPIAVDVHLKPASATRRLWPHKISILFGAVSLGEGALGAVLFTLGIIVLWPGTWVTILIGIIITAFFIPNMLRKGTIDLLLVKPLHRWALLFYKYIGGLTFIFFNTAVVIVGIWLVLGLRSGVWANGFLLSIFGITFYFAILYAVSTLFAVLTQSPVVSILMTCGAWAFFAIVGSLYHGIEGDRKRMEQHRAENPNMEIHDQSDNAFFSFVRGVHTVVPRTSDLTAVMTNAITSDFYSPQLAKYSPMPQAEVNWVESLTVSGLFIALMLGLSCWWFATRDY